MGAPRKAEGLQIRRELDPKGTTQGFAGERFQGVTSGCAARTVAEFVTARSTQTSPAELVQLPITSLERGRSPEIPRRDAPAS